MDDDEDTTMVPQFIGPAGFGVPELLIILAVIVLLFGAKKLPEVARGSGRALRIFKAETRGLGDDGDDEARPQPAPPPLTAGSDVPETHQAADEPRRTER